MIIASNFKTNYTRGSAKAFIKEIQTFVSHTKSEQNVRIFAPFTALDWFDEIQNIKVGA